MNSLFILLLKNQCLFFIKEIFSFPSFFFPNKQQLNSVPCFCILFILICWVKSLFSLPWALTLRAHLTILVDILLCLIFLFAILMSEQRLNFINSWLFVCVWVWIWMNENLCSNCVVFHCLLPPFCFKNFNISQIPFFCASMPYFSFHSFFLKTSTV